MPNKLLLTESLVKAQKLQAFLGEEWRVEATFGHVCDFPRKKLGIEIQSHFKPTYLPLPEKTKLLARIKQAAENVDAVYIGMDTNGEGESIAWHTLRLIHLPNHIPVYRLTLSAITTDAVKAALQNPTALDQGLMEAEETRRILDRLVSYNCSPAATKLLKRPVRVERLEALLLRMLVEREQQIEASEPSPRYALSGKFQVGETPIEASLVSFKDQPIGEGLRGQSQVQTLMQGLEKGVFWIGDVHTTQETLPPPPPFTMSSLLQLIAAFDLPIASVRAVIHALYEGGWITFPYPPNENVPSDAAASVRKWIEEQYGAGYLSDEKTVIPEGIRPTNSHLQPEQSGLTGNALVLYTLIWKRFVASHMTPAVGQIQRSQLLAGESHEQAYPLVLEANHETTTFDGYLQAYGPSTAATPLPHFTMGEKAILVQWLPAGTPTQLPAHYTLESLVEEVTQAGVASQAILLATIQQLLERGNIEIHHAVLIPSTKGHELADLLATHFPQVFALGYQATLGKQLSAIAGGKLNRATLLQAFWEDVKPNLASLNRAALAADTQAKQGEPTGKDCPTCGAELRQRHNRAGHYLICSRYPDCSYTEGLVHQPILLRHAQS